jgi:hypothetical protein
VLREELGLAVHQSRGMSFERFGDLRVQLPPSTPQQTAVSHVLQQRVFIDRVGRPAFRLARAAGLLRMRLPASRYG